MNQVFSKGDIIQNLYGPSALLGLIIGSAIIADDFIRPHPHHRPMPLPRGHHPPLSSHSDHKTEVMERDGDKKMPLSSEMRVVIDAKVKGVDHEKTRIMVKIGTTSSMPAKTAKQWPKRYAR